MRRTQAMWLSGFAAMVLLGIPMWAMAESWVSLPPSERWEVRPDFKNDAVLDKNTGLIVERRPDLTPRRWTEAMEYCLGKEVGGVTGWRLPRGAEMPSMIDPNLPPPYLPPSVFPGVRSDRAVSYWTSEVLAVRPTAAGAFFGENKGFGFVDMSSSVESAWCVRGPSH